VPNNDKNAHFKRGIDTPTNNDDRKQMLRTTFQFQLSFFMYQHFLFNDH